MWRRKLNLLWLALARQSMLETEISVRGGPVAVWNAREQALREQNYLLLLKVRKDKRQQHMANCVVSDKSCLDVCNSLQLYRDKQGVHTTYKCIQVLHSICTKVLCLQFVQGRATHRGTNEPTWPMAQTPCSHGPNVTADVLYKTARLRVSGHLEPSGAIWTACSGFCYDQNVGGALLDQPCLDGSIWLDGLSNIRFERMMAAHPQTIFCFAEPGRSCK